MYVRPPGVHGFLLLQEQLRWVPRLGGASVGAFIPGCDRCSSTHDERTCHTCHACHSRIVAHLHTCILAYLHTCTLAPLHTCILAYLHTCTLAYLSPLPYLPYLPYLHPCTLAHLHTCILAHTWIGATDAYEVRQAQVSYLAYLPYLSNRAGVRCSDPGV